MSGSVMWCHGGRGEMCFGFIGFGIVCSGGHGSGRLSCVWVRRGVVRQSKAVEARHDESRCGQSGRGRGTAVN